jgi:flagellar motor switch protein FliN/FliY
MASDLRAILSLEVPFIVLLGERQMKLAEVVALSSGSILELPKNADDELTVLVNNKPMGTGVAVKVGENYGVRIAFVGDLKSRILALNEAAAAKVASPTVDSDEAAALAEAMLAGQ